MLKSITQFLIGKKPSPPPLQEQPLDLLVPLRALSAKGCWAELEKQGRDLLATQPMAVEVLELVAYSLQQQGRFADSLALCKQASSIDSQRWLSNFVAGLSLRALGRTKEASAYFHQAAVIAPKDPQTARLRLETQIVADGIEAAVEDYRAHRLRLGHKGIVIEAPVQSVREWSLRRGLSLLAAGEQEEILFEAPAVWGQAKEPIRASVMSNLPYVVEIPDAQIFSRSSLILTSDHTVLSDTAGHHEFGSFVSFAYENIVLSQQAGKVLLDFEEYETHEIPAGIWMSGLASNAFGHWLPEFLPKLQFLQFHSDFPSLPIIIDDEMPPSHTEHLRRLVDNPLLVLPPKSSFFCRRLLVAPSPTFYPVELLENNLPAHQIGALSPRALKFLRGGPPASCGHSGGRIFLGRKAMKWRRLLNEEEIARYLSGLGFQTVYMEDLTATQQIALFQGADWIVAPNGSSLLNLIFADPKIKLLVLSQNNLFNWGNFQGPMTTLGYRPVFLCGEEAEAIDQKHSDYRIPLYLIRHALSDMGMSEAKA